MRHRRGTPGLTPYRLRTIEAGYPRRRRPARHLRRGSGKKAPNASASAEPATPHTTATGVTATATGVTATAAANAALQPAPRQPARLRNPNPRREPHREPHRQTYRRRFFGNAIVRRRAGARRRVAAPHVAMGVAGAITLALLIVGGYQAATGAAVMLGMF